MTTNLGPGTSQTEVEHHRERPWKPALDWNPRGEKARLCFSDDARFKDVQSIQRLRSLSDLCARPSSRRRAPRGSAEKGLMTGSYP